MEKTTKKENLCLRVSSIREADKIFQHYCTLYKTDMYLIESEGCLYLDTDSFTRSYESIIKTYLFQNKIKEGGKNG